MRPASALIPASAVTAFLLVGGALVYAQAGTTPADTVVWAETTGAGVVFPACGSASTVGNATCNAGGTAQVTLSWEVTGVHHEDSYGVSNVYDCTTVVLAGGPAGPVDGQPCTGTYTFTGLPENSSIVFSAQGYSGSWASTDVQAIGISTPDCTEPPASGTPTLSISKQQLSDQIGQSCVPAGGVVHPGDQLCYRMYVVASGADQSGVQVRDHIPGGTTMVWQGGGTDTNSSAQIAGGVDGLGDAWWYQYTTPASGWNAYVDFTAMVNDNFFSYYPPGSQVCNVATIQSQQIGAIGSNTVCNAVGPNNPAWIAGVCDANGYASIQWASSLGATAYYPRLWIPSGSCPSGWTMWSDNHTCYINGYTGGTSVIVAGLAPGAYSAWVLAG